MRGRGALKGVHVKKADEYNFSIATYIISEDAVTSTYLQISEAFCSPVYSSGT